MNALPHNDTSREFTFSDAHFSFLAGLANQKTGIVLTDRKKDMVYGRLARRLRILGISSFDDYCELLKKGDNDEMGHLVNAITTNLTRFFREPHHFEHLRDILKQMKGQERIRLWSAGCSSGMEPYSMAMCVADSIPNASKRDVRILATDIDSNILSVGSQGEYPPTDVETVPSEFRKYISTQSNGNAQMASELRELIKFNQLNLLEPWPMKGQFDIIFCRNVIIYFDKETKCRIFEHMARVTQPGAWMYIGHSENLNGVTDKFKLIGRTIYQRV